MPLIRQQRVQVGVPRNRILTCSIWAAPLAQLVYRAVHSPHRTTAKPLEAHVQYMGSSFWPSVSEMLVPAVLKLRTCGGVGSKANVMRCHLVRPLESCA